MLLAACSGGQPGAKSVSLAEVDRELGQLTAGSASLSAPLRLTLNSTAIVRIQRATMHVTLSATLVLDGIETPRVIRTFDRTVNVDVTLDRRVMGFLAEDWRWVLATVGAPLLGGIWRWRRRTRGASRRGESQTRPG